MRIASYPRLIIAISIASLGLASCTTFSPQPADEQPTTTQTSDKTCAATSGAEALAEAIQQVPPPFPSMPLDAENQWSRNAATDTYDPCATLSWINLEIDRATLSSPYQVVFFHHGVYAGRATDAPFGFPPQVKQLNDTSIEVGFSWPEDGEPNAMATVKALSTYSIDESTGRISHEGELPPGAAPAL